MPERFASAAASSIPMGALIQLDIQKPAKPMRGTRITQASRFRAICPRLEARYSPIFWAPRRRASNRCFCATNR